MILYDDVVGTRHHYTEHMSRVQFECTLEQAEGLEVTYLGLPYMPNDLIHWFGDTANPDSRGATQGSAGKGRCRMRSYSYEVIGLEKDEKGYVVGGKVVAEGRVVPKSLAPGAAQEELTELQVRFKEHDAITKAGGVDGVEINIVPFVQA